ncbi:MAG TPA: PRC-barrel domain-containing protein [Planctomycetaceae bacterium]|nr:PRC-barrel domain-containing protein [Planctomycetaceae bacterium]
MRRSRIAAWSAVALGFSLCVFTVLSDDAAKKPLAGGKGAASETRAAGQREHSGVVLRAKEIAGLPIKNSEDQDLGKVEDVVIDMETGSVRYAAIAFGGTLGVGDKLFAVPFPALHVKHDAGSRRIHFVLNVDKKMLEKAKGFDKKEWPDFADPRFAEENDRYFREASNRKP